jgi:RNA polymerase sigma factor (sigma-70 family)
MSYRDPVALSESAGVYLLPQHVLPEDLERRCSIVVARIIKEQGWQLLDPSELVQRTIAQLRAGAADRPESAAIGAYCMALHAACSGAEGSSRQNLAYGELARYLYSLTFARFPDLSSDVREDVAQSALERVFRSFERCREPVAFLAFAGLHLLDAARSARRHAFRPVDSLEQAIGSNEDTIGELLPDSQPEPVERVLVAERRAAIERLLEEIAADHPRAAQQVAILRMTWLDDLDDPTISQRLGISLSSVYAARSRLIKTIQSEPKWQARARALGLLFDEV